MILREIDEKLTAAWLA